jgi:hypothetical protein
MMKTIPNFNPNWLGALVAVAALFVLLAGCGPEVTYCAAGDPSCLSGCEGGCPSGQTCQSDRCVDTGSDGLQCKSAGDECNPMASSSDGFLCIDWDGEGVREAACSELCDDDGSCPAGSSCFALSSNLDTTCQVQTDCRAGMLCIQGTCRFTACQPSECSGSVDGDQACEQKYADHPSFPDGAKCYEFDNQSNYCFPAGQRQMGEQCIGADAAVEQQNFEATCATGLGCVGGTCRTACETDDECGGDETCTFGQQTVLGEGVGFCANTCTPFVADSCPDGQMCEPVDADTGHCVSAGSSPAFAECAPGEGECEAGTLCVEYAASAGQVEARCHPVCDLSVAPAGEEGSQAARDATCPQSPPALASMRIAHLAETLGPLDIYVLDRSDKLVDALDFEGVYPGDDVSSGGGWQEFEPGRYQITAVAAGAPRSDPPLIDVSVDLTSGVGKAVYIAPPSPDSSEDAQAVVIETASTQSRTPDTDLQVVHLLSDAGKVDVVAVAASDDATDTTNQQVLAEGLEFGQAAPTHSVGTSELRVLVFAQGSDRSVTADALVDLDGVTVGADSSLFLRGTLDPDDFYSTGQPTLLTLPTDPASAALGPQFSCTAVESGAYGYCQQVCTEGAQDFGQDACLGDAMGCTATDFPDRDAWLTLCAPVGQGLSGAPCDPARPYGQCGEGFYCMQYGTGAAPNSDGTLGQCTPLCDVEGDDSGPLGCDEGQSCRPVVYDSSYGIGECGWECEPGVDYHDQSCPQGLESCKPVASLMEDGAGQAAPSVTPQQPFCSPSGLSSAGQPCRGLDCTPGTECMYPRSEQTDLVSTLLSPYFGASGLVPTCTPQCDPFDGDSSTTQCASGQTCLPNYPWSAEVGHCAAIEEQVQPMQPCTKPGLSCGEDSICVLYQGGQQCFRFCDYLGADSQGAFLQSSCPEGMACGPFVQDIGRCVTP